MSGLLNYTTTISAEKTIAEIYGLLSQSKIQEIRSSYDGAGNVTAIAFTIKTSHGVIPFMLPINVKAAAAVLNRQAQNRQIPRKFLNDVAQARRVAWRILRQWLEAQLAIVSLDMAKVEEVFLPYAQNADGKTVFEVYEEARFAGMALPAPQAA